MFLTLYSFFFFFFFQTIASPQLTKAIRALIAHRADGFKDFDLEDRINPSQKIDALEVTNEFSLAEILYTPVVYLQLEVPCYIKNLKFEQVGKQNANLSRRAES